MELDAIGELGATTRRFYATHATPKKLPTVLQLRVVSNPSRARRSTSLAGRVFSSDLRTSPDVAAAFGR